MIASGDLTHRGRARRARRRGGVPAAASARRCSSSRATTTSRRSRPRRFTHPWREFERHWETTQPVYASPELHVVGRELGAAARLPVRARRDPSISSAPRRALGDAAPGALRVVARAPPARRARRGGRGSSRSSPAAACSTRLAAAGAELIVGGHTTRRDRLRAARLRGARRRGALVRVVATAPGLGRPRPGRRVARCAACSSTRPTSASITRRDARLAAPAAWGAHRGDAHVPARTTEPAGAP